MKHYVPAFTRINGRRQQAACGAYVCADEHSTEPNCEPCLDYLTAEAAASEQDDTDLNALRAMEPDPALLVESRLGNPTAGYRPKGQR